MKKIKLNTMIISSLTVFSLLTLVGCGSGGGTAGSDTGETPTDPVVITPDPIKPPSIPATPVDPIPPVVDPYKSAGWYGKTQISATASDGTVYSHTTAGVFGELVQSDDAKDQHDILGYGTAILQVVFPQSEWDEEDNGDYFSNYTKYDENNIEKRVWTFQIKNQHTVNLASTPITINLEGIYDVKYKEENGQVEYKESTDINQTILNNLHLVDVDNANEYTLTELQTVTLTMDGPDGGLNTRTFRWVLGTVDSNDFTALAKTQAAMSKPAVFSQDISTDTFKTQTEEVENTGGKFGLPPQ